MRYKIFVKALQGDVLVFSVDNYNITDELVTFLDSKTNIIKRFHVSNCEIQEVSNG